MHVVLKIALYVLGPLAWGLAVGFLFERLRRRRGGSCDEERGAPHDWII